MTNLTGLEIAIVGMAGRFPSAANVREMWDVLCQGKEGISAFSDEELHASGVNPDQLANPNYVRKYGYLDNTAFFDALLFGYSAPDAAIMDPQIRVFHECAWTALENAGYLGDDYSGLIGLYAGASENLEWMAHLMSDPDAVADGFRTASLTSRDYLCSRVAYALNLHGPAITVQTACSTSLVAIHLACQGLINGECDIALAGGVAIRRYAKRGYIHTPGSVDSLDGTCRPFDTRANGIVSGDGCGIVVLRRLEDAIRSGDYILAAIKGSAVMNDGRDKMGFTAPGVGGQARTIRAAQHMAEIAASSIGYVEAHGTGTRLGDPIEIESLAKAFNTPARGFCRIGSLKSNFGHLDVASGVAGVIKATLCLQHEQIPASLHFESENENIRFDATPFTVNQILTPWAAGVSPRLAGVSSFGIGGTNAHAILEEAPRLALRTAFEGPHMVFLSANSQTALENAVLTLRTHVRANNALSLLDLAFTLHVGRRSLPYRRAIVAHNLEDLDETLFTLNAAASPAPVQQEPRFCFLFTNLCSQNFAVERELYKCEQLFREEIDRCCAVANHICGIDYRSHWLTANSGCAHGERLLQPASTRPLRFMFEYCLARFLIRLGCRPAAMLGNGTGEYVAACLAGVFTLEGALELIIELGRLEAGLTAGATLLVQGPRSEIMSILDADLDVAEFNSANQTVVSGDCEQIYRFAVRLEGLGMPHRILEAAHPFNTRRVEPILGNFREKVIRVNRSAPRIPFVSSLSGHWLQNEEALSPDYWVRHLRSSVQFERALTCLQDAPNSVMVEVGLGSLLTSSLRDAPAKLRNWRCCALIPKVNVLGSGQQQLYTGLCQLFVYGCRFEWSEYYGERQARRVPLPTYCFDKLSYGALPGSAQMRLDYVSQLTDNGKCPNPANWFYEMAWKIGAPAAPADTNASRRWLIFLDDVGLGRAVAAIIVARNERVTCVSRDREYREINPVTRGIDPKAKSDYSRLAREFSDDRDCAIQVVHLWGVFPGTPDDFSEAALCDARERSFDSVLLMANALNEHAPHSVAHISILTSDLQNVTAHARCAAAKAASLGLNRVLSQEFPQITSRHVDIHLSDNGTWNEDVDCNQLFSELCSRHFESVVAFRRHIKWVESFTRITGPSVGDLSVLRENGIYLITGGLGRIGMTLAHTLIRLCRATVVLVSRSRLPPREDWSRLLQANASGPVAARIAEIQQMEAIGGRVELVCADVVDFAAMREVFNLIDSKFGTLNGILHAAGEIDAIGLSELEERGLQRVLEAKVQGTQNIYRLCDERPLDFCVLFSSISTILGGLGLGAYSAANSYLCRFAHNASVAGRAGWIAVDWDGWTFNTIAPLSAKNSVEQFALRPEEGSKAFLRVIALACAKQRIVISTGDLHVRYKRYVKESLAESPGEETLTRTLHARPALDTPFVEPATETQRTLAEIWKRCLGLDRVGIMDNLFDLGGDSLLITRLASAIKSRFAMELSIQDLFELTTIGSQAEALDEQFAIVSHPIPRADRRLKLPLSFAQQRLWIIDQLGEGRSSYHIPTAIRLRGRLDRTALRAALQTILDRHEALRTCFAQTSDGPIQKIDAQAQFDLQEIDLSRYPPLEWEARVREVSHEDARTGFDLAVGPLVRGRLVCLSAEEYVLLITMHHIVSDGWSMGVLVREAGVLYSAYLEGRSNPLPPLPIQYADYALWQRQWLQGDVVQKELTYWKRHLDKAPTLLELPMDFPRPAMQSYRGDSVRMVLSADLSRRVKELARTCNTTLFMALYGAFAIMLSRLSGAQDLVVGVPVANRQRTEVEGLIGFFVNTLALRVRVHEDLSVREFLGQVRELTLGAYGHQDIPFDQVVDAVQPPRSLSHSPLFQVLLSLQNEPQSILKLPGLVLDYQETSDREMAKFDLSLVVQEIGEQIVGSLSYASDLFERSTIGRWAGHFQNVLEGMVQDAEGKLTELSLLNAKERAQIVEQFNATAVAYPDQKLIHELFEEQVERTPQAIAVLYEDRHLTYARLNEVANQLAHYLRNRGVGRDQYVAIFSERSIETVVAMLGVLKAGGAYVPIDPSYPSARIRHILDETATSVVLTEETFLHLLPQTSAEVVCHDRDRYVINAYEKINLNAKDIGTTSSDLAYVIYTSGSTGQPKGVMIEHKSIVNYSLHVLRQFDVRAGNGSLILTSLAFDLALTGFYPLLLCGRSVRLAANSRELSEIATLLTDARDLAPMKITPSHIPILLQAAQSRHLRPEIRVIVCGGEPLQAHMVKSLRQLSPEARIFNHYGPTEATVGCATYELTERESGSVPIGRPISNTQIYILDRSGRPVPIGQPGELVVAGAGVARGYLKQRDLTAERFVANTFSLDSSARMYKTGDLARWRSDGNIEYIGRRDQQVKIRGFRIELGEIESHLCKHPKVKESVVLMRTDIAGEPKLVAYLTHRGECPTTEDLREHLKAAVPDYMLPQAFEVMDTLPVGASGKLDRNAFPLPDFIRRGTAQFNEPHGELETVIASIWKELLHLKVVGRDDDFFDLGGNSLLATIVSARLENVGINIPVITMFQRPTLRSFAETALWGSGVATATVGAVPLREHGSGRPLFVVHMLTGDVFPFFPLARTLKADIPVYALRIVDKSHASSIEWLASNHINAMRVIQPQGPYRIAGHSFGGLIAYEIANQLLGEDELVEFVGMIDSHRPMRQPTLAAKVDDAELLFTYVRILFPQADLTSLGEVLSQGIESLLDQCKKQGLVPEALAVENVKRWVENAHTVLHSGNSYRPEPLPIPIHLFTSDDSSNGDSSRGWQELVGTHLNITAVGGSHVSILQFPHVQILADGITSALEKACTHGVAAGPKYSPTIAIQIGATGANQAFCVPGAGASVSCFIPLAKALGRNVSVHGLQPRGLDTDLPPHSTVPAAAIAYIKAIRQVSPRGPYRLVGHSYGGWVALDMARRLTAMGEDVKPIVVIDSLAPTRGNPKSPLASTEMLLKLAGVMEQSGGRNLDLSAKELDDLDYEGKIEVLMRRLIVSGMLPKASKLQTVRRLLRVFTSNLNTQYVPETRFSGRIVLVRPEQLDPTPQDRVETDEWAGNWLSHVAHCDVYQVAGNHMTMLQDPGVRTIAGHMQKLWDLQ